MLGEFKISQLQTTSQLCRPWLRKIYCTTAETSGRTQDGGVNVIQ